MSSRDDIERRLARLEAEYGALDLADVDASTLYIWSLEATEAGDNEWAAEVGAEYQRRFGTRAEEGEP